MSVSFKDYVIISDAFVEAQLDEGKIWDAIKKKFGGKASDEEIAAEVERLKGLDSDDMAKIKKTAASRDFHERKAKEAAAKIGGTKPTVKTRPTGPTHADWEDALPSADRKFHAKRDRFPGVREEQNLEPEGQVNEAMEFTVTYTSKGGGPKRKTDIKGRDIRDVRRKFNDTHYMKQVLGIAPKKVEAKKVEKVEEEETFGPLGPRS